MFVVHFAAVLAHVFTLNIYRATIHTISLKFWHHLLRQRTNFFMYTNFDVSPTRFDFFVCVCMCVCHRSKLDAVKNPNNTRIWQITPKHLVIPHAKQSKKCVVPKITRYFKAIPNFKYWDRFDFNRDTKGYLAIISGYLQKIKGKLW